jgi:Peptidase A4 family
MTTDRHLIPSNLDEHFFIKPPADGTDLLRATNDVLHRHGLPHRPDPGALPNAARAWLRVMRRIKRFEVPQLTVRHDLIFRPLRRKQAAGADVTSNWGGLVMNDAPPYQQAWGSWTIPEIQIPPNGTFPSYSCALWVGLGGYRMTTTFCNREPPRQWEPMAAGNVLRGTSGIPLLPSC